MKVRTRDPLAAALGNASLLGIGYFMLGRWRFAVANLAISFVLVAYVVAVAQVWAEIVVLVWWMAVAVHGWFLAGWDSRRPADRPAPAPVPWGSPWGPASAANPAPGAAPAPGAEPIPPTAPAMPADAARPAGSGPAAGPVPPAAPAMPADSAWPAGRVPPAAPAPANPDGVRGPRLIAAGAMAVVLLAFGLLRFDAVRIGENVADARADGDCAGVQRAQGGVWLGDRIGDAPLSAEGDGVVRNCRRLQTAATDLDSALRSGDPDTLERPFGTFETVLNQPGNEKIVEPVLNRFLSGLPTSNACDTAALTDWLRDRKPAKPPLNRTAGAVRRTAPAALLGCADDQMNDENWDQAKARYQQLVDDYPDDERAGKAKDGAELANVSGLLDGSSDDQPAYCSHPAKYSNAPKYGKGTNKTMFFGNTDYTDKLPKSWKTDDPASAALIVCAGDDKRGSTVQGCPYTSQQNGKVYFVRFHKINIPVQAYELRTGKRVADRTIEISGSACPPTIHWSYYSDLGDTGPEPDQYVRDPDVDGAFHSLVVR